MISNSDEITDPIDLVNGFRAMSVVTVNIFCISLPIIFGGLWTKFRPDSSDIGN